MHTVVGELCKSAPTCWVGMDIFTKLLLRKLCTNLGVRASGYNNILLFLCPTCSSCTACMCKEARICPVASTV